MDLTSTLTCPDCQHTSTHRMPTDACVFFHVCAQCDRLIKPLPGDCCVFCSYGTVPCPPVQDGEDCCG